MPPGAVGPRVRQWSRAEAGLDGFDEFLRELERPT